MTSLPTSSFAIPFLFVGASNTMWGTVKLPFGLGPAGAPTCTLYISPDLLLVLANVSGRATLSAGLPSNPSLVGVKAYSQGFVGDSSANNLGVAVSNAVEKQIGQRF